MAPAATWIETRRFTALLTMKAAAFQGLIPRSIAKRCVSKDGAT
jgi:hypothetical protein